jgi:CheY-like chemotaxis protein
VSNRRSNIDLVARKEALGLATFRLHDLSPLLYRGRVLVPARPGMARDQGKPTMSPIARPLRVLIADDHVDSAETLSVLISMWGHESQAVFDGRSALNSVDTFQPDVLILDILMPNLDGFELAEALRRHNVAADRTALIAHSAYFDDDYRHKALEVGIDHYLLKPVDPTYLRSLLQGILEARQFAHVAGQ